MASYPDRAPPTTMEIQKPPPSPAPTYATLYPRMCEVARPLGYALGLHGSMKRDLDVIACPWTEDAAAPEDLVEAIREFIDGFIIQDHTDARHNSPALRPHGRLAYSIHFGTGSHFYIDLSIMPRQSG